MNSASMFFAEKQRRGFLSTKNMVTEKTGRRPIVPHPKFIYSGDALLMTYQI